MNVETRLRNGADEAHRVAAEFDRPGIEGRSSGLARRAAFAAAAGAIVVAIVIAGIWTTTWILNEDDEIADLPSPDLDWQQVENLPDVGVVTDIWADDEGFNIWSGNEIWTSRDGHEWSLEIETPSELGGYAVRGSVVRLDSGWIGIGNPESVPTVYRWVGDEWIPSPLPNGADATTAWRIASNESGIVVAGATAAGGDLSEPELLVWHSSDGSTWQIIELGGGFPLSLESSGPGFVLVDTLPGEATSVWVSNDGVGWAKTAEFPTYIVSEPAVFRDTLVATSLQTEIIAVQSEGVSESISTGPAFGELEVDLRLGEVDAGAFGILASAFDSSTEDVPVVAIWYTPDAEQWVRYDLLELFGEQGGILTAVGDDSAVVAFDPGGSAYVSPEAPYQLWVTTAGPDGRR